MSDNTSDQIKKKLTEIYPSEAVSQHVASILANPRPHGYSRKSNSTYYTRKCAEEIQACVDKQIETREDFIYFYSKWCDAGPLLSKDTLYQRVYSSIRFLCERMDPDNKYKKWYEEVSVTRDKGVGVRLTMKNYDAEGQKMQPDMCEPKAEMPKWKAELEEWLEDSDAVEPFRKERLALTPEEIRGLKYEFEGLTNVQYSITPTTVSVIKTS